MAVRLTRVRFTPEKLGAVPVSAQVTFTQEDLIGVSAAPNPTLVAVSPAKAVVCTPTSGLLQFCGSASASVTVSIGVAEPVIGPATETTASTSAEVRPVTYEPPSN